MSEYWEALASRLDGMYTQDDFEAAAYRLVSEQCLYHADQGSRTAYSLVERFEREFERALGPLGIQITVNRTLLYVTAIPKHPKHTPATKAQTLFGLVLRAIYEEFIRVGNQVNEHGEVICDLIEFGEKYRLWTNEDHPIKGEFDGLMKIAKRWGIARRIDDDELADYLLSSDSQGAIAIRPGITEVLGEAALHRLATWQTGKPMHETEEPPEGDAQ